MGQENLPWDLVEGKTRADDPRFWPGGAQLSGETFENALIVDVDITAAELIGAKFKNCTLARLDLRDGFMSEAIFENCIFYKCDLRRADLTNATLTDVTIDRSNLCSAKFSGVQTENFRLMRSEVSPCDFRKSKLAGFFSYCDLSAVNFDGADIQNLELFRCNIKFSRVDAVKHECTTSGIEAAERAGDHQVPWFLSSEKRLESVPSGDLEDCYFFGLDLSGHSFKGRHLKNVNFLRCNLTDTDFSEANIDNVWIWDCEIDQLTLDNSTVGRLTMSYVMGTITGKNAKFDVWNVYDSELEGSNFEGASVQVGTFSMAQFPNSNFSNMGTFIVESFMTDFIGCNFENTDLSKQAAERSYFDEGVQFIPISQSPLRHVSEAGDINFFYLPITSDSSSHQKQAPKAEEKAPFQPLQDAAPFKGVDEPAEIKAEKAPTPVAAAPAGFNISPVEESVADFKAIEEPKAPAPEVKEQKRSPKPSKPFGIVEDSEIADQLSRPTLDLSAAPHIKDVQESSESKPKLDLKPEPQKPSADHAAKPSLSALKPSLGGASEKVQKLAAHVAEEVKHPSIGGSSSPGSKISGSGPAAKKLSGASKAVSSPFAASGSSKLNASSPGLKKPLSGAGSSAPAPTSTSSASAHKPFGPGAHKPAGFGASASSPAAPVSGSTPGAPVDAAPSPAAPFGNAGQAPAAGGPAAPGPVAGAPVAAGTSGPAPVGGPAAGGPAASGPVPGGPATAGPAAGAPGFGQAPAAGGPAATGPVAGGFNSGPPTSSSPAPAATQPEPAPAAQAPVDAAPAVSQPVEEHHTDLVQHQEPVGFFARIINWIKSLFGG